MTLISRRVVALAVTAMVLTVVLGACGSGAPSDQRSDDTVRLSESRDPVATLDRLGAFVVQCGDRPGSQQLWINRNGLHQLTRTRYGGVSRMSVNDAGVVAYGATETLGSEVHVLRPGSRHVSVIGAGNALAVAADGRIAFARTEQTRRPLRDNVYVFDGTRTRKVASFPLVWDLFWRKGALAAMIGPGKTHLVWDVKHPSRQLALPGRGGRTIQLLSGPDLVAAQLPDAQGRYGIGIASRSRHHFKRVATDRYPVAWSPSGRFLLASDPPPSTRLSVVDIVRRVTIPVGKLPCGQVVQAAWLPRGTKLPALPAG